MNTREIATEYRLTHWAGIMCERKESGLSVKAFCENAGIHENAYYYWQKKLREAACGELSQNQCATTSMTPASFMEVKLAEEVAMPTPAEGMQGKISVEYAGLRIMAGGEYPVEKLAALMREMRRPC